jgi:2-haloacid dehalogenase
MRSYRGFLLDADNTIFDYDRAEGEALDETLQEAAAGVPGEIARAAYRTINKGYWERFEVGAITLADLKTGRFADLLRAFELPGDPRTIAEEYLERLARKAYFLPGARAVVEELSRRAVLCLVTNGISKVQRGRIARAGIDGFFSAVLISEELGVAKPDARFFRAACDAVRLPASDLLCVGDNPVTDVEGARRAGIDACWFSPSGAPWPGPGAPPPLVIRDLGEIVKLAAGSIPAGRFLIE